MIGMISVWKWLALVLLCVCLLAVSKVLFFDSAHVDPDPNGFFIQGLEECAVLTQNQTNCYKQLVEEVLKIFDTKIFVHTIQDERIEQSLLYGCHIFFHFYGQSVAKQIGNIGETLALGTPTCFAGFYHGALENYFLEEAIFPGTEESRFMKVIPALCKREYFDLEQNYYQCLHGLGHSLMFATDSELPLALKYCDVLDTDTGREMCYSGAFMENSFSNTNPVHQSKYIREEDPSYPCTILDEKYRASCYQQQTGYLIGYYGGDWGKVRSFCNALSGVYQARCFNGLGQQLVGSVNISEVVTQCGYVDKESGVRECLRGTLVAIDAAYPHSPERIIDVCVHAQSLEFSNECTQRAVDIVRSRVSGMRNVLDVCNRVDDQSIRSACIEIAEQ